MHPDFGVPGATGENYFYVYYTSRDGQGGNEPTSPLPQQCPQDAQWFGGYLILSRFEVTPGTLTAIPGSEQVMIKVRMYNSTHRGGGMVFGDDGFLYLTTGDQAQHSTAQTLDTNLDGGVLRIDVDQDPSRSHAPIRTMPQDPRGPDEISGVGYWIPNSNPFPSPGGLTFEEYYTIGHRNPHRMTKDKVTGTMYIGEIGSNIHEEINVVQAGNNYGWPVWEGAAAKNRCTNQLYPGTTHTLPLVAFPRSQANSIIGGYVYRGSTLPSLYGKYICGDYGNGEEIWSVDTQTGAYNLLLAFTPNNIISFGQDHQGELFILKQGNNTPLYRLTSGTAQNPIPPTLSQTGAFTDLATLDPAPGLIPYDLIESFWSDGAEKKRWMAIPNDGSHNTSSEQIQYSEEGEWVFPVGAVLVKHFELPTDETNPAITRRLETRFSIKGSNGEFYFLTYKWRADGSDADLLEVGLDESYTITTATGSRSQSWHYPSRTECTTCHDDALGGTLGPRTRYLNKDFLYPSSGISANQLVTLSHLGILNASILDTDVGNFLTAAAQDDASASLEHRARSYLDLNCGYCHRPATGNRAVFDARLSTPLAQSQLFSSQLNESIGLPIEQVIYPSDTSYSVLYKRAHSTDPTIMMPPLAKSRIDESGTTLIAEWIMGMDPNGPCTTVNIASDDFESGFGIWTDGGSDAARINNAAYASSGNFTLRLRDNTNTSVITTPDLDWSDYSKATLDFSYQVVSFDNVNEDFWLQLSTDGGATYTTIEEWNLNDEFVNNQAYTEQVEIPGPFTAITRIRFRCDASGNSDWVYLDDISLTACEPLDGGSDPSGPIGEVDAVQLTDAWTPVTLTHSYTNPVVVAGAPGFSNSEQTTVRVRNVSGNSFEIRLDEWDCLDGGHPAETVPYMVVEAGVHTLANGTTLMAGNTLAVNTSWKTQVFPQAFGAIPLVFAQCVSENETDAVSVRIDEGQTSTSQTRFKLKEQDKVSGGHAPETVGWIALEASSGTDGGVMTYEAASTGRSINHQWNSISFAQTYGANAIFIGGMGSEHGGDASTVRYRSLTGSGAEVKIEEEPCGDTELNHTTEVVNYLVFDSPGDILPENSEPVACSATGTILMEQWDNIGGGVAVSLIPLTSPPTGSQQLTSFEVPVNVGDNYGARVSGYICAPQTGTYTFWISSDDNGELWLSTDEDPANISRIAHVPGWSSSRQWDKYPEQQSIGIFLEAGKSYYVEALFKEQTGGDNLAIGWQLPDGALERPIGGSVLSPAPNPVRLSETTSALEWLSVNASRDAGRIWIDWAVNKEQQIDYYQVERSMDGELFLGIAHEKSMGDANGRQEYQVLDAEAADEFRYYRIMGIGKDGQTYESPVLELSISPDQPGIWLAPNPTKSGLAVRLRIRSAFAEEAVQLTCFDLNGRSLYQQELRLSSQEDILNLPLKLAPGIYFIRASGETWEQTQRLLVQ